MQTIQEFLLKIAPNRDIAIILYAVFLTAVIYSVLPLVGYVLNKFEAVEMKFLSKIFGEKFAQFFCNRLTFIGTIIHEYSHAFFAKITGATVTKISPVSLFKGDELGSVQYSTKGNFIARSLQNVFTSAGPVIIGLLLIYIIGANLFSGNLSWWQYIIYIFLLICIINHSSMSPQDISIYYSGLKIAVPLTIVVLLIIMILNSPATNV